MKQIRLTCYLKGPDYNSEEKCRTRQFPKHGIRIPPMVNPNKGWDIFQTRERTRQNHRLGLIQGFCRAVSWNLIPSPRGFQPKTYRFPARPIKVPLTAVFPYSASRSRCLIWPCWWTAYWNLSKTQIVKITFSFCLGGPFYFLGDHMPRFMISLHYILLFSFEVVV